MRRREFIMLLGGAGSSALPLLLLILNFVLKARERESLLQ
jgi:hypothetical protein